MITEIDIKFEKLKPERRLIYNFKDPEGLKKFRKVTSYNGIFLNIFNKQSSFKKQIKVWHSKLKRVVNDCFRKVRLRKNKKLTCKKYQRRKNAILNQNLKMRHMEESELRQEDAKNNLSKLKLNLDKLNNKDNGKITIFGKSKIICFKRLSPLIQLLKETLVIKLLQIQFS